MSGTPVESDEFWPEAVGYGQPAVIAGRAGAHARLGPAASGYPAPNGYDQYGDGGYDRFAADPGWAAGPEAYAWQERPDWRDWGPPPALYPDHPSAPVPR